MNQIAPIVLFVYNRPEHTVKTVDALTKNEIAAESHLYIFSDGPKSDQDEPKVGEVRKLIASIKGFRKIHIIEREQNLGLANSVITGIGEILDLYQRVIVLEDDMISTQHFLSYMNNLLAFYQEDLRIFSVTGYTFPIKIPQHYKHKIYLSPRASSWGWGTWKDRWGRIDWELSSFNAFINDKAIVSKFNTGGGDLTKMLRNQKEGKIDSWSIIWSYEHFRNNAYCVYPVESMIQNIGADLSGVHTSKTKKYEVFLNDSDKIAKPVKDLQPDEEIIANTRRFFKKNILNSVYNKLIKSLK